MATYINHIYVVSYYMNNGNIKERDIIADNANEAIAWVKSDDTEFKALIVCQRIKD